MNVKDIFNIIKEIELYYGKDKKNLEANVLENISMVRQTIDDINYVDSQDGSLIHLTLESLNYNFGVLKNITRDSSSYLIKAFVMINILLRLGVDPNIVDKNGNNFLQVAVKDGNYDGAGIKLLVESAKSYGLDLNHTNNNSETFLHTLIYSGNYLFDDYLKQIIDEFLNENFDMSIKDSYGKTVVEAMNYYNSLENKKGRYTLKQMSFLDEEICDVLFQVPYKILEPEFMKKRDKLECYPDFGQALKYSDEQTDIVKEFDDYINELIFKLASLKNIVIESNTSHETNLLINELVYRIANNHVPNFLDNTTIFKINPLFVLRMFEVSSENNIKSFFDECSRINIIFLIENINTLLSDNNDFLTVLDYYAKLYFKMKKIKIIGLQILLVVLWRKMILK